MTIETPAALRDLYAEPKERAVKKEIAFLDVHCRNFIRLSPFVVLATSDREHNMDSSPRGGEPGFVKVTAGGEILIPDAPGNNRLDSLQNISLTGKLGLLFLIPGVDETLRVNGSALLSSTPEDIRACTTERRAPKLVVRVTVQSTYLHCAKALMRSKLWDPASLVDRSLLPTMGQMLNEQTATQGTPETQEEMARRYAPEL